MGSQKFRIGERVRVKRYQVPKGVRIRYGGKMGKIVKTRHIKGRLWYEVSFGPSFYGEDTEEFTSGELTMI